MIWLLIGYMWLFVHRPFEIWPWLATIRIERVYMIFTIICWFFSSPQLPPRNRLHLYFSLFIVAMLTSWFMSPYPDAGQAAVENYLKFGVFYVLLVTTVRTEQDLRRILVGYLAVMAGWMVHSLREFYFFGNVVWAQGFGRLVPVGASNDFNDFAGFIVCSLPLAWALWRESTDRWGRGLILGYCALSCYCIVLTGSRMGFIGMVLASILACLASAKRWRLLALYPILFGVAWNFMPEGQKERYDTLLGEGHETKFSSAGDYRLGSLERSLPMFEERPIFGFGPMGFAAVHRMMPHNLYGQLLAELGAVGAIAFGLILWGVTKNTIEARRIVQATNQLTGYGTPLSAMGEGWEVMTSNLAWYTVAAVSASILLLAIMAWGFNFLFWHTWLWYGGFQVVALSCLKERAALTNAAVSLSKAPVKYRMGSCL